MATFSALGVPKGYVQSLKELGITSPTPIQQESIPKLLNTDTDCIGLAQTGTGKTVAFGIPALASVDPDVNQIQVLILSPTRELVQQIKKQLFKFTKYVPERIFMEAVFGGEKIDKQINNLKRTTHVLVATPGRLIDLIERGEVNLKHVKTLILDEADEMLSMGFKQDLNRILKYTSGHSNTWLFSATMPEEIKKIVKTYMDAQAVRISVDPNAMVNKQINHFYIQTSLKEKLNDIIRFLESKASERGIIFCRTKAGAQNIHTQLEAEGFSVGVLEGDMQQKERDKVMRAFKNESLQYLVSTDVSARGIDVSGLGFVVHHQLPEQTAYYTHRSGRTARAGQSGQSVAFILPNEVSSIKTLEKELHISFKAITF